MYVHVLLSPRLYVVQWWYCYYYSCYPTFLAIRPLGSREHLDWGTRRVLRPGRCGMAMGTGALASLKRL